VKEGGDGLCLRAARFDHQTRDRQQMPEVRDVAAFACLCPVQAGRYTSEPCRIDRLTAARSSALA
jgi:hypothetical protein